MATVNIGNLTFTHKGDYDGSTAYSKNDVVYYSTNGNAYIAKQATTGNVPTNGTYWNQFAQGSGGIWNAGLSLGSASQNLRVNSGGNALEFYTPTAASSDYEKLLSYDISSAVTGFNMTGWINSAYSFYVIRGYYKMVNANGYFNLRLIDNSGNSIGGSAYYWASRHYYVNAGGSPTSNDHGSGGTSGWQPSSTNSLGTSYHGQFEMHLSHDNLVTAEQKGCFWNSYHREQGGQVDGFAAVGWAADSSTISGSSAGIQLDRAGSNSFGSGNVTIYGLK